MLKFENSYTDKSAYRFLGLGGAGGLDGHEDEDENRLGVYGHRIGNGQKHRLCTSGQCSPMLTQKR